jgi:hypothetical protein
LRTEELTVTHRTHRLKPLADAMIGFTRGAGIGAAVSSDDTVRPQGVIDMNLSAMQRRELR